jgi:hypothetical protein
MLQNRVDCFIAVVVAISCLVPRTLSATSPPAPCGTLDLSSPLVQHCFPSDGSHHAVCCVDISNPENPHSPHGNYNPLGRVIKAASNSTSYSWCTCSEEICTEQLGGRVAWNQNGLGWKGYVPPRDRHTTAYNAVTGLPANQNGVGSSSRSEEL